MGELIGLPDHKVLKGLLWRDAGDGLSLGDGGGDVLDWRLGCLVRTCDVELKTNRPANGLLELPVQVRPIVVCHPVPVVAIGDLETDCVVCD